MQLKSSIEVYLYIDMHLFKCREKDDIMLQVQCKAGEKMR